MMPRFSTMQRKHQLLSRPVCQIVKSSRAGLRHSDAKWGADGNTRFSHGTGKPPCQPFVLSRLRSGCLDITGCARAKGPRQRNGAFPCHFDTRPLPFGSRRLEFERASGTLFHVAFNPSARRRAPFRVGICGEKKCFFSRMKNESAGIDS